MCFFSESLFSVNLWCISWIECLLSYCKWALLTGQVNYQTAVNSLCRWFGLVLYFTTIYILFIDISAEKSDVFCKWFWSHPIMQIILHVIVTYMPDNWEWPVPLLLFFLIICLCTGFFRMISNIVCKLTYLYMVIFSLKILQKGLMFLKFWNKMTFVTCSMNITFLSFLCV